MASESLFARIKNFFSPSEIWVCHYWKMEYPERNTETFPSQLEANACCEKRQGEGYIAMVRFEGTVDHAKVLKGAASAISGIVSTFKVSSSSTTNDK